MAAKKAKKGDIKMSKSSSKKCDGNMLCGLSLVCFVMFLLTTLSGLAAWALSVRWWVWLLLAIIIGWKPMKQCCNK